MQTNVLMKEIGAQPIRHWARQTRATNRKNWEALHKLNLTETQRAVLVQNFEGLDAALDELDGIVSRVIRDPVP
jgi:hypothetical protein